MSAPIQAPHRRAGAAIRRPTGNERPVPRHLSRNGTGHPREALAPIAAIVLGGVAALLVRVLLLGGLP